MPKPIRNVDFSRKNSSVFNCLLDGRAYLFTEADFAPGIQVMRKRAQVHNWAFLRGLKARTKLSRDPYGFIAQIYE